jgi:hypothetical protein
MNKSTYLAAILALWGMAGCSSWGEEPAWNVLEVERAAVSFDAFGGTGAIEVRASGAALGAQCNEAARAWCDVTVSDSRALVRVSPNPELLERAAVVTLTAGGKAVQVPVTQAGLQIAFDRSPLTLPGEECDTLLALHTSAGAVRVVSSQPWLAAGAVDGKLMLHAAPNPNLTVRRCTLTLTAGPLTVQVDVAQQPPGLRLSHYVGDWTLRHRAKGVNIYQKDVTITAAGADSLRATVLIPEVPGASYSFVMRYDPETGTVNIPLQKVFEDAEYHIILSGYLEGEYGDSYIYAVPGGGGFVSAATGTLLAPALNFTDDGAGEAVFTGFVLYPVSKTTGKGAGGAYQGLPDDPWPVSAVYYTGLITMNKR